ncbi:hypothetical protein BDA96_02G083600 [Sorghum bicolor]|uniref:Uncharacterized protein n=1 Tax=Sorghum bicolor TaxID=4558 RepID=A0A921RM64_SORBI|nr:hypothetical protein BDA96_02G083600 [Sorghum bicolor]
MLPRASSIMRGRFGAGSNRREEKRPRADSFGDDDEGTQPMDMSAVPAVRYHWVPEEFCKVCLSRHFEQARDSPSSYFHTHSQFKLFRGGLDIRPMHLDQQWVSWSYLERFVHVRSLVDMFEGVGWRNALGLKQDWNEAVIRQFYATLEVRAQKEELVWMTGTRKFKATFKDLAAAVGLNYQEMKQGKLVVDFPRLQSGDVQGFYYQDTSVYGPQGGLRRIPKLIYEILRRTIVPSAGANDKAIGWPFYEMITAVMSGEKFNLLDWTVNQMLECKRDVHSPLAFQPYIMALVLRTVGDFRGVSDISHEFYRPFFDQWEYLERKPSPMSCRVPGPHSPEPIPLEVVPPDSPVPLEVVPPSPEAYRGPSFASSSHRAAGTSSSGPSARVARRDRGASHRRGFKG